MFEVVYNSNLYPESLRLSEIEKELIRAAVSYEIEYSNKNDSDNIGLTNSYVIAEWYLINTVKRYNKEIENGTIR